MPLNPEQGEVLPGLGKLYRVVDKEKWARTPLFEEARVKAHEAFRRTAGKFVNADTKPLELYCNNFVVQEYPLQSKLVFLFHAVINGEEHFYPYTFELPRSLTEQLHVEGMWSYGLPHRSKSVAR